MKKLSILILPLLLAACASKPAATPEEVAMTFLASVINDWGEHKLKFVDSKSRARLKSLCDAAKKRGIALKPDELLVSIPQARDNWLGKKSTKIITRTDTTAVVEITTTANAPKITLDLVKEGGEWKVSVLE